MEMTKLNPKVATEFSELMQRAAAVREAAELPGASGAAKDLAEQLKELSRQAMNAMTLIQRPDPEQLDGNVWLKEVMTEMHTVLGTASTKYVN